MSQTSATTASPKLALKDFGYISGGWRIERHLRFLADTTGNGLPDIVGFADSSVTVALNNGDGTFSPGISVTNDFTYSSGGWRVEKHPRFVADLTGDGTVDIIGFSDAGVVVAIGNGDGTFQSSNLVLEAFGYNRGWRVDQHPRFIADVNGNGCGDIVGFASDGVYVALNKGNGTFDTPKRVVEGFGTNQGFRVDKHPRFLADLTGNGTADIIGFGESWVWVSYNDGAGNFSSPAHKLTDKFAFNDGQWAVDKTVRWVTNMVRS
ncbi:hypothetical protein NMY22_g7295 [Coprinellus aureogranulatus]|nr:hypothetical protein NMY22_g7295 [Coprinellus aureogranulatus]